MLKLVSWDASDSAFLKLSERSTEIHDEFSIGALAKPFFVIAHKSYYGDFGISTYQLAVDGSFLKRATVTTNAKVGGMPSMAIALASAPKKTVFVTATLRAPDWRLSVDVWEVGTLGEVTLFAHADGDVTAQAAAATIEGTGPWLITTAHQDVNLNFSLTLWLLKLDGTVTRVADGAGSLGRDLIASPRGWGNVFTMTDEAGMLASTYWRSSWEGLPANPSFSLSLDHSWQGKSGIPIGHLRILPNLPTHETLEAGTDLGWTTRNDEFYITAFRQEDGRLRLVPFGVDYQSGPPVVRSYLKLSAGVVEGRRIWSRRHEWPSIGHLRISGLGGLSSNRPRKTDFMDYTVTREIYGGAIARYAPRPSNTPGTGIPSSSPSGGASSGGADTDDDDMENEVEYGTFSCTGTVDGTEMTCEEQIGNNDTCLSSNGGIWCPAVYVGCTCSCTLGACPNSP
jgi:hypothetical protein